MFLNTYICESVNSVGMVKSTLYAAQLECQTIRIVDYPYTEKYPDRNVVTVVL